VEKWLVENLGKNIIKDMAQLNASFGYREVKQVEGNFNVNISMGKYGDLSD
jgi:hypothetical protein